MSKFTVGQSVWFDPQHGYAKAGPVTVTKVGRKWITTEHGYRFDVVTGREEGFGLGRLWPTQADAEADAERRVLWKAFIRQVAAYGFDVGSVRVEDIRGAARLLGVTL